MILTTEQGRAHSRRATARDRAVRELAAGFVPLLVLAGVTASRFALPPTYLLRTVVVYALMAVLILRHLPRSGAGLGPANWVTLGRATLVLSLATLVPQSEILLDAGYWGIIGVGTLAMVLDGVDGQVARRTRSATAFGARFDMELDSLLMLVLAALVWRSGQVGPWVLLLGLPRYLFVAAGRLRPWLRAPLPERVRRKAGCVIQGIALLVCLGPIVPSGLATVVAALTLALLVSSFAVDVVWLSTRPK
jgi:phosphatidylglycerophosphate synthase